MNSSGYCKKIGKMIDTIVEKKFIKDGNSPYPAGSRTLTKRCLNNDCEHSKRCKIEEFDAIDYR